jgi:glycosyltransferase involved in cell wall biosynthesis
MIKYSFIIPTKEINDYARNSISKILSLRGDDFEIIVYPDEATSEVWEKTRQITTGRLGPAQKRNLAIRDARGEILIFIDDDAYPQENFLEVLEKDFEDKNIVAVGGPALTPREVNFGKGSPAPLF